MATTCPKCGDANAQSGIGDSSQCLSCGARFDSNGDVRDAYPATVLGNLADLQRLGATEAPKSGSPEFVLPPGVTAEDAKAGAELAADRVTAEAEAPNGMRPADTKADVSSDKTKADAKAEPAKRK